MKLEPVIKLDKRNTAASKKFNDDLLLANYDVIAFFQVMANLQPSDKTYSLYNNNLLSYKN